MASLDLEWIRQQFPALSQEVNGHPVIFLDGPGGTQVPTSVITAIVDYLTTANANSHGMFATSVKTDAMLATARTAMADFLGCDSDEIVFGANMTTLTFALSRAIEREIQPGDEIIVTQLDHDANVAPWLALEEAGATIRVVNIHTDDCTLDMDDFERYLNPRTKLVAVGYASNAVGTVNDVATIVKLAHSVGALVFVDAVHYAPHGSIDVRALECDFLTCSAYKFFGPHGGILYGKREVLTRLRPYKARPALAEVPWCWETGTQNHEGIAGLVATIEYLTTLGRKLSPVLQNRRDALITAMTAIQQYEHQLSELLIPSLLKIPGLTMYGITDPNWFGWRTPTVGIRVAHQSPKALAKALGDRGIFTWNGNFYALNLTQRLGVESSGGFLRIGFVHYNTPEEVHRLVDVLHEMSELATSTRR
jgi:cysteine desulfurase family protein (TIGR01976 family)